MISRLVCLVVAVFALGNLAVGQTVDDPSRIEVYVTPYYNSKGPVIDVGPFSKGLAANNEAECFRDEATYWFYSAQYRGRLLGSLVDREKMGSMGDPGFELVQAANAFQQLVGPYINGYAFGDIDNLVQIVQKVQKENLAVPDLNKIYPRVIFKKRSEWQAGNTGLNEGMTKFLATLKEQKADIKRQRAERGMDAKFSKLPNKPLPNASGSR